METNNQANNQTKKKRTNPLAWGGWKKELAWAIFFLLLFLTAWGYYQDRQICAEAINNPCEACAELQANQQAQANLLIDPNPDIPIFNVTPPQIGGFDGGGIEQKENGTGD